MPPPNAWKLEDFELGRSVGAGQSCTVFLAREQSTGFICAIKMLPKDKILQSKMEENVLREIQIMSTLRYDSSFSFLL